MRMTLIQNIFITSSFAILIIIGVPIKAYSIPVTYEISGYLDGLWVNTAETTDPDVIAAREAFRAGLTDWLDKGDRFTGTLVFDNMRSVAAFDPNMKYVGYSYEIVWESGLTFSATNYLWAGGGLIESIQPISLDATEVWDGFRQGGNLVRSGADDDRYNYSNTFEHALELQGSPGLSDLYGGWLGGDWAYYGPNDIYGLQYFGFIANIDSISKVVYPMPEPATLILLVSGLIGLRRFTRL